MSDLPKTEEGANRGRATQWSTMGRKGSGGRATEEERGRRGGVIRIYSKKGRLAAQVEIGEQWGRKGSGGK